MQAAKTVEVKLTMTQVCAYAMQLVEDCEDQKQYGEFAEMHAARLQYVAAEIRRMAKLAKGKAG